MHVAPTPRSGGPDNNEMKLTRSAQHSVARPSQLISVLDARIAGRA